MTSQHYRVSKEIILNIAEHCDLDTLSSLTQTSKDMHHLVTEYEHSIARAKIAASSQPPIGLLLSSEDEQRCIIPVHNSFDTVRELIRRESRCDSLLNRGSFLLTSELEILGMTQGSLNKFKAGLQYAFRLADQIADIATDFSIPGNPPPSITIAPIGLPFPLTTTLPHDEIIHRRYRAATALRYAQISHVRRLPSRALAWLVTLAAGASKGYARYSTKLLETDPAMADARVMAFKEVLLRHGGSLVVWGFMRGAGTLAQFVKQAVSQCAKEVLFFEEGGQVFDQVDNEQLWDEDGEEHDNGTQESDFPSGLHMSIMQELTYRIQRAKREAAEKRSEVWDEEELETRDVWEEVHKLVAHEVGCASWKGYAAIKYPPRDDEAEA